MRCTVLILLILIFFLWIGLHDPEIDKTKLEYELYPLKKKVELIRLEKQKARLLKEIEEAEKEGIYVTKRSYSD